MSYVNTLVLLLASFASYARAEPSLSISANGRLCPDLSSWRLDQEFLTIEFKQPWQVILDPEKRLERSFCQFIIESDRGLKFEEIHWQGELSSLEAGSLALQLSGYFQAENDLVSLSYEADKASYDWQAKFDPQIQLACGSEKALNIKAVGLLKRNPQSSESLTWTSKELKFKVSSENCD